MTETTALPTATNADRYLRATTTIGVVGIVLAALQLAVATFIAIASAVSWSSMSQVQRDNSMFGPEFGYFFAGVVGVPSLIALILLVCGLVTRRRGGLGLGLAIIGLVITAGAALLFFSAFIVMAGA